MTETDDFPTTEVTVTCHTEGCENADIPLVLMTPDPPGLIVCGPCGQEITDIEGAE